MEIVLEGEVHKCAASGFTCASFCIWEVCKGGGGSVVEGRDIASRLSVKKKNWVALDGSFLMPPPLVCVPLPRKNIPRAPPLALQLNRP